MLQLLHLLRLQTLRCIGQSCTRLLHLEKRSWNVKLPAFSQWIWGSHHAEHRNLQHFAMFLEKQALKKEGPVQIITFIRLNIREKNHFDLTWDVANKTCQRLSKLFPWSRRFEHVASDFSAFLGSWQLPAPLGGRHAGCGMRTSAKSRVLKPPARWGPLTKSLSWP